MAKAKKKKPIKHSFQVDPDRLEEFQSTCNAVGLKFYEGLDAALEDWINFQKSTVAEVQKIRKTGAKKKHKA